MRRPNEKLIAGIDLHSNNLVIGVINLEGQRIAHRKLDCDLKQVKEFLRPLQPQLQSLATYRAIDPGGNARRSRASQTSLALEPKSGRATMASVLLA